MPIVAQRTLWTSQPQVPVGIDWSNPLTRGLVVAVNGATLIDHVSGKPLTITNNNGRLVSSKGLSANFNNSMYGSIPISWSGGPFTLFAVGNCSSDIYLNMYCSVGDSGSSANDIVLYRATANDCSYLFSRTSGSYVQTTQVDNTNLVNTFYTLAGVTHSSTDRRIYRDGVQLGNVTTSLAVASSINTFYYGAQRTSGAVAGQFSGAIPVAMLFNRALSAAEVKSISDNPWQIFAPANRPLFFDLGTGGAQTLTQSSRFDNANNLSYTHTISQVGGAQTLTQSTRFDNAPSFFTHTLSSSIALAQSSRFDNTNALSYTHTLTPGTVTLSQSARFDNTNALSYVHTLSQANSPQTLTQDARFDNTASFFTHTLSYAQTLAQSSAHTNAPTFFTHSLSTSINLSQSSRFDNSNALAYTHVVTKSITLDASWFDNDNLFFAHALTPGAVTLSQSSRYDNSATFFAHVLTQAGNQTLVQSATETNANSFYAHAISFSYPDVARPSSDVSGTWFASTGTDKYAMVDEVTMDNSDYIYTNTIGAKQRMTLNAMADPGSQGQVFSYSVWSSTGHGITVRLLNRSDDSVIAEWVHPGPLSTIPPADEASATHQSLTPTQIAAIQDYSAIDIEVEAIS